MAKRLRLYPKVRTLSFPNQTQLVLIFPMKILILIASLVLSLSSFASVSILSDLDDTIKITEASGNPSDIIGDDVYTGMPEFFTGAKEYSNDLYVLSASPSFMRSKIKSVLKKHKVTFRQLILRGNLLDGKFEYKVREIKKVMAANQDDFVLIGDDIGKDPEVYAHIQKLYPNRILASYIHVVNGRPLVNDVIPYWTSFDLFMREYIAGRMSADWVETSWAKLLSETKIKYIFPKKADCPTEASIWDWQMQTVFQQEAIQLMNRMIMFCQQRQSDNILL